MDLDMHLSGAVALCVGVSQGPPGADLVAHAPHDTRNLRRSARALLVHLLEFWYVFHLRLYTDTHVCPHRSTM